MRCLPCETFTRTSFENMVASIVATNQLTFFDDELPPEGTGHIKALYISVKANDRIVSKVLIDNGSALNVCPLTTLEKLDIDPSRLKPTSMTVWDPQRSFWRDRLASGNWLASL